MSSSAVDSKWHTWRTATQGADSMSYVQWNALCNAFRAESGMHSARVVAAVPVFYRW
eukprot:m.1055548 g.1055548  ORF g.1055548 m.1055548 type:complete len:57 (-) comp24192_c1_seq40:2775-2945(-)